MIYQIHLKNGRMILSDECNFISGNLLKLSKVWKVEKFWTAENENTPMTRIYYRLPEYDIIMSTDEVETIKIYEKHWIPEISKEELKKVIEKEAIILKNYKKYGVAYPEKKEVIGNVR